MKETAIFYGSSSGKTAEVAGRIQEIVGPEKADLYDVADADPSLLPAYSLIILGIPTWGIGAPQDDWAGFMDRLGTIDLRGKRVALFGLGDQESYPESFADALGSLYDEISKTGATVVGQWPAESYSFQESAALRDGKFAGLVLDEENQPELTNQRLERWLDGILGDGVSRAGN